MRLKDLTISILFVISVIIILLGLGCRHNSTEDEDFGPPNIIFYLYELENDEIIYSQDVFFSWKINNVNTHMDTVLFRIRPSSAPSYVEILLEFEYPTMTYIIDTLEPATLYYWNIYGAGYSVVDSEHPRLSRYSETRSFTTADHLYEPGEFCNPSPDSGAIDVGLNPTLSCQIINPDTIAYEYDLYFGETIDPPLIASNLSDLSYNIASDILDYGTTYYWRYEAYFDSDTLTSPIWEFTTEYSHDVDMFTLIEIDAYQSPSGYHVREELRARIDTGLALSAPIMPLQADSVKIENTRLDWQAGTQSYSFTEMSMPFIENGSSVEIDIYGNEDVSSLNVSEMFPACTLAIISPESFESVSISGFEVTWDGSECGGNVILALLDGTDSTGVWKETANDGTETLTATDLQSLEGHTGVYDLYLIKQVEENITASGYKPQSLFRCRVINRMLQINILSK